MKRLVSLASLVIMMAVGVITLLTYFVPALVNWRYVFVEWAIIIAAFAMLLGIFNLLHVHGTRIVRLRPGWFNSFVLFASLSTVLVIGLLTGITAPTREQDLIQQGLFGAMMTWIYQYVLIPIQASLAALLPFFLGFAAYRTLRMRSARGAAGAAVFLITAIMVLLGQVPLLNQTGLYSVRDWIIRVPAMAGMRGILMGAALGITATALRVLITMDRPSSD